MQIGATVRCRDSYHICTSPRATWVIIRILILSDFSGFTIDPATANYKGEKMIAVYLKEEFGGFAVHLLQK